MDDSALPLCPPFPVLPERQADRVLWLDWAQRYGRACAQEQQQKYEHLVWMVASGHDYLKASGFMSTEELARRIDDKVSAAVREKIGSHT